MTCQQRSARLPLAQRLCGPCGRRPSPAAAAIPREPQDSVRRSGARATLTNDRGDGAPQIGGEHHSTERSFQSAKPVVAATQDMVDLTDLRMCFEQVWLWPAKQLVDEAALRTSRSRGAAIVRVRLANRCHWHGPNATAYLCCACKPYMSVAAGAHATHRSATARQGLWAEL